MSQKSLYDSSHFCQIRVVVRFRPLIASELSLDNLELENTPRKARQANATAASPAPSESEKTPRRINSDSRLRVNETPKGQSTPPQSSRSITTPSSARRKSSITSGDMPNTPPQHSSAPMSSHILNKHDLRVNINHVDERNMNLEVESAQGRAQNREYTFDRIFRAEETQDTIYREVASPIIDDILEGYNGTIMAYGQTGSGKTYSMLGPDIVSEKRGIIPRCCSELFTRVAGITDAAQVTLSCSYIQIYMETIQDLLNARKSNLRILEKIDGGVYVEKLTEEVVTSVEEVIDILGIGEKNRIYAATNMNEHSSRSHCLFMVKVDQIFPDGSRKRSLLNFVDLAGSERLYKTGVEGLTLEEGKKINLSLSSLSRVIHALSEQAKGHIPYRDSKLTRILQESIGGNAKTSLIINCSPCKYHIEETISSLAFGQRAKTIKNSVHINQEESNEKLKQIIVELKHQIEDLQHNTSGCNHDMDEGLVQRYEQQIADLQNRIRMNEHEMMGMRKTMEDQREIIIGLKARNKVLEETCHGLRHQLAESEHQAEVPISMMEKKVTILERELENFREKYSSAVVEILEKENTITQYEEMLQQSSRMDTQLKQAEITIRHMQISEKKTVEDYQLQLLEVQKRADDSSAKLERLEAYLKRRGIEVDFDEEFKEHEPAPVSRQFKISHAPVANQSPVHLTHQHGNMEPMSRSFPQQSSVMSPMRKASTSDAATYASPQHTQAANQAMFGTPMVMSTVGYIPVPVHRLIPLTQLMANGGNGPSSANSALPQMIPPGTLTDPNQLYRASAGKSTGLGTSPSLFHS